MFVEDTLGLEQGKMCISNKRLVVVVWSVWRSKLFRKLANNMMIRTWGGSRPGAYSRLSLSCQDSWSPISKDQSSTNHLFSIAILVYQKAVYLVSSNSVWQIADDNSGTCIEGTSTLHRDAISNARALGMFMNISRFFPIKTKKIRSSKLQTSSSLEELLSCAVLDAVVSRQRSKAPRPSATGRYGAHRQKHQTSRKPARFGGEG